MKIFRHNMVVHILPISLLIVIMAFGMLLVDLKF